MNNRQHNSKLARASLVSAILSVSSLAAITIVTTGDSLVNVPLTVQFGLVLFLVATFLAAIVFGMSALVRIRKQGGHLQSSLVAASGFVLGVLILVVTSVTVVRSFYVARTHAQRSACRGNLRMLEAGKEQWAMANRASYGPVNIKGVASYIKGNTMPCCPTARRNTYVLGHVGEKPRCTIHGKLGHVHLPGRQSRHQTAPTEDRTLQTKRIYYDEEKSCLKCEYSYIDQRLVGVAKTYYTNGQVKAIEMYSEGALDGTTERYYGSGTLELSAAYANGVLHGTARRYYENGQLKAVEIYREGAFLAATNFWGNGQTKAIETYRNGNRNGKCTYFRKDGKIWKDGIFQDDELRNGIYHQYHKDWLYKESRFRNGKENGLCVIHYEDGRETKVTYVDAKREGVQLEYAKDGALECRRYLKNDHEVGRVGLDHGRIKYESTWDEASGLKSFTVFGATGNVTQMRQANVKTGQGVLRKFGSNGQLSVETKKKRVFPLQTVTFDGAGRTNTVWDHTTGVRCRYAANGRKVVEEYFEYNTRIWKKQFDEEGNVVATEAFATPESVTNATVTVTIKELPGERGGSPEEFYGFKDYPQLRSQNEKRESWSRTIHNWCYDPDRTEGSFRGRFPKIGSIAGGRGARLIQSFIAKSSHIKAIVILSHAVDDGPGWLRLTVLSDEEGRPAQTPLARSWLRVGASCPVPSGGLLVFRLPPIEWERERKYWIEYAADGHMVINYPIFPSETYPEAEQLKSDASTKANTIAGVQVVEQCGPVPMQCKLVLAPLHN